MKAPANTRFEQNYQSHLKHLKLKGLQPKTIEAYSRAIRRVGDRFDKQIDNLSEAQLTDYFTELVASHSWSTVKLDLYGLQFYYAHVLRKPWVAPGLIKPPKSQRLPDIVTVTEAQRIFAATRVLSYRVFFFTLYSLGLRLGEGLRLQVNTLRQALKEYLSLRRSLGFKLREAGKGLLDFVTFIEQHRASYITQALALAWAQQPTNVQPAYWAQRLSFVRGFARYRSATDQRTQVPPQGLLPFQPKRARPYLYSDDEIRSLLGAALDMPCRYERGELRPWTYHCVFGLLSVSGLRLGEARNLELQDVDLDAAVLTIRGTKFGKSRLVPLHASTCKVLADYIARRKRHWAARPVSSYLFVSSWGTRLDGGDIHRTFYALSRQIGLRGVSESHGPRLHDMRHAFATNTLVRWYKSDQDPERRLPILSAYLGHVHVADTQWYLSGSPELMREAMRRLEHRWEARP